MAAVAAVPASLPAQHPWRLTLAAGPYRVDDLAGTPTVPTVALAKSIGQRGLIGGTLGLIQHAGFYRLDALTLDLGVGRRSSGARLEWTGSLGPAALLGGDSDGTPYLAAGGHATVGLTWWVGRRIGLSLSGVGRVWLTTGNARLSPSATAGVAFRL